jgi:ribosomal protein S18 acetylase RimI-like enzyme
VTSDALPGLPGLSALPGLTVRRAGGDDWRTYRDVRLASLLDSPHAFWTTYEQAAANRAADWRSRLEWPTWIAMAPVAPGPAPPVVPVGLAGLWHAPGAPPGEVLLVQMWVAGWARGRGVATALIEAVLDGARGDGWTRVVLDVAQANARASACYRRAGFRPTGETAVMPWDSDVTELRMALDLV